MRTSRTGEVCSACAKRLPVGVSYCVWCGIDLAEAERYREDLEAQMAVTFQPPGPRALRAILANRRKVAPLDGARALLAYELLLNESREPVRLEVLSQVDVKPLDYQVRTAIRVLSEMHGRAILADEVGLGKTIEAGLVLAELLGRKLVRNVLLLVPSSLVEQWRVELEEKFHIVVATHETPRFWRRPVVLLSLTRAKQGAVARRLGKRSWDLVIVDEAHALKNHRTLAHTFVRGLDSRRLLLLTATPIENDLRELYNLLTLVDPAAYPTFRRFSRDFLESRFKVRDVERLRRFCESYMVRNRRTVAFPELPPRQPRLVACRPAPEEMDFLKELLAFVRAVYGRAKGSRGGEQSRATTMLFLTLLLKESCSSPQAVLATVESVVLPHLEGAEQSRLEALLEQGRQVVLTAKMGAFLDAVAQVQPDPAVAYVEFFATHQHLQQALTRAGVDVVPFTGRMNATEKQQQIERFREHGGLLLCTEVGGQGLNLQHCNIIINYDVPWNPMRLEQRIGRVHRYGQERPIKVVSFVAAGTYEERVFQLLTHKLELFTQAIGEVEAILSFVEEEESIQQMVARAIIEAESDDQVAENFDRLRERFEVATERFHRSREATSKLFDVELKT